MPPPSRDGRLPQRAALVLFVQVLCIVLVSVAMALSLAHALELPGKLRLDERIYRAVQAIYYE